MATITLRVEGSDVGIIEVPVNLNATDSDRLMGFLLDAHGTDPDGNPRTSQAMIEAYWDGIVAGTLANVLRYEQERAAKEAREAVTPIVPT